MSTMTPTELRAEAQRIENEAAQPLRGKVYIYTTTGSWILHTGKPESGPHPLIESREATEAEVQALCQIPEFAAYLESVRAGEPQ